MHELTEYGKGAVLSWILNSLMLHHQNKLHVSESFLVASEGWKEHTTWFLSEAVTLQSTSVEIKASDGRNNQNLLLMKNMKSSWVQHKIQKHEIITRDERSRWEWFLFTAYERTRFMTAESVMWGLNNHVHWSIQIGFDYLELGTSILFSAKSDTSALSERFTVVIKTTQRKMMKELILLL